MNPMVESNIVKPKFIDNGIVQIETDNKGNTTVTYQDNRKEIIKKKTVQQLVEEKIEREKILREFDDLSSELKSKYHYNSTSGLSKGHFK